jgi:hypothetical protein
MPANIPVLNQAWDSAAVTTLAKRSSTLAKLTLDRHPLLSEITVGHIESGMGLRIEKPIEYGRNTSAEYLTSPEAKLELVNQEVATMATFRPSLLCVPVKFNKIEKMMNSSKERFINLMTLKENQALRTQREIVAANLWGKGENLKTIGLGQYVPVDPTSGIVGNINRATAKFWRSQTASIGSWLTNGHLGSAEDRPYDLWQLCSDGDEQPSISVWDPLSFAKYRRSLGNNVRYVQTGTPGKILGDGVGYPKANLMYQEKPAIVDKKADPNTFVFIHKEHFEWYVAPGMNFEPTEMMQLPLHPLVTFVVFILYHQWVCTNPMLQGRGHSVTA